MKKHLFALMALAILTRGTALAFEPVVCDPQKSPLCSGLMEWWSLGEPSDSSREGSVAARLWLEDYNLDFGEGSDKVGSDGSLYLGDASGALRIPRGGTVPSRSTIAFWYYPATDSSYQVVWTNDSCEYDGGETTADIDFDAPTTDVAGGFDPGGTTNPASALSDESDSTDVHVDDPSSGPYTKSFTSPNAGDLSAIPPGATITAVKVKFRAKEDSADDTKINAGVTLDGSTTWSVDKNPVVTYTDYTSAALSRPGGGSWSVADLASLSLSLRVQDDDTQPDPVRFAKAYVEVTYKTCSSLPGITIAEDSDGEMVVQGHKAEGQGMWTVRSTTAPTVNDWNLVIVTFSPFGDYGQNQVCISVTNDGSSTPESLDDHCTSVGYFVQQHASSDWLLGDDAGGNSPNSGYVDGLGMWGRTFDDNDALLLFNAGTGEAYPFY